MGSDLYFFEQCETRQVPRRYRKLPEELPESLRFAHLNPKVAALLASKERQQKVDSEDPFGDGMGKKSLLPDINAAFQNVRNQFDSALSNDEDSQRYLFEEAKMSASSILYQLSLIIYRYEDLYKLIPKSLEYHLMSGYNEFTSDIVVVPREWQTQEMKEHYLAKLQERGISEEDYSDTEYMTYRSKVGTDRSNSDLKTVMTKRSRVKLGGVEAREDGDAMKSESRVGGRRTDSRMSSISIFKPQQQLGGMDAYSRVGSRRKGSILVGKRVGPSESKRKQSCVIGDDSQCSLLGHMRPRFGSVVMEATALANPMNYMQTINFQLSNTAFEDKGWIMLKGRQEEVNQSEILDYCVQRLQESMKQISVQQMRDLDQGYDKPCMVRYYGDAKKETLLKYRKSPSKSSTSLVYKGGKPKIPVISDERDEGKKIMQTCHVDGSTVVYYPSGRPAVIYSAAGFGRPGYYTIVYEDGLDSPMLACFTPRGRGVCYYDCGTVRFLATEKGGHISEEDGKLIRKWKWPHSNVKITEPMSFQLNSHVIFRCIGQHQMSLSFSCQKEMARFSLGPTGDPDDLRGIEDGDQLLTALTFSSRAAKDLMRIFAPHKKQKKKSRKYTSKSQSTEIIKLLTNFPDKVSYELEADKELARLQRKARNLVDDWMEHYRLAVGLASPHLQNVRETPSYTIQSRNVKSARTSDYGLMIRRAILGVEDFEENPHKKQRIPSAPLAGLGKDVDDKLKAEISAQQEATNVTFEDTTGHPNQAGDGTMSPTAMALINRLTESAGRRSVRSRASTHSARSMRTMSPTRQPTNASMAIERIQSAMTARCLCPLVTRQVKQGIDRPLCRCSRHHIPNVMDIELDSFIESDAPEGQLIVIMVASSLFPGITKAEEMLSEIYNNQNRNRTRPCIQSRNDMFRVFRYDINSAAEMSDHTQPILLTRHNVIPGMFLIYCDGRLLFCDHIFNGYGNTRKDFKKQIMKSRHDALAGFALPKDFRFSPSKGRSGLRSAWGGEIGGAGVDKYSSTGTVIDSTLQPIHRHDSNSTSSGETNKDLHLDAVSSCWYYYIESDSSTSSNLARKSSTSRKNSLQLLVKQSIQNSQIDNSPSKTGH